MKVLNLAPLALFVALSSASGQSKPKSSARKTASKTPAGARTPAAAVKSNHLHFVVAPTGNEARYRVTEQLAGFDLPNDVVGVTKDVAGKLVVDPDGKIVKDSSKIVVLLSNLASDKTRRDNFLKKNTLETAKFPQVELVPVSFDGLTAAIPAGTTKTFSIIGDLTIHGVTHPTTWQVNAHADGNDVVGTAKTQFTFKQFSLEQPRVPVVLSVADTIHLEYDFRFAPESRP